MALEWMARDIAANYADELVTTLDAQQAGALTWYLRDLEMVGNGLRGMSVLDLEDEVSDARYGLQVSWDELIEMLAAAQDVHDLVVTGHREPTEVSIDLDDATYPGCAAVVEIFDSTTYRVGREPELAATDEEYQG